MPADAPSCSADSGSKVEDYHEFPDDQRLFCVYCGHQDDHGEFLTRQQRERAMGVLGARAEQYVSDELDRTFRDLAAGSSQHSAVHFEYRAQPDPGLRPFRG